jgi:hypothetical protein
MQSHARRQVVHTCARIIRESLGRSAACSSRTGGNSTEVDFGLSKANRLVTLVYDRRLRLATLCISADAMLSVRRCRP